MQTRQQIRNLNPERLQKLLRSKKSLKEICALCGICQYTLYKRTKEYGLKTKRDIAREIKKEIKND